MKISVSFGLAQGLAVGEREVVAGRSLAQKCDKRRTPVCERPEGMKGLGNQPH